MRHFYATSKGFLTDVDIFEGGFLRYGAYENPYLDLFRFSSLKERKSFIDSSEDHKPVTVKEIKENSHLAQQLLMYIN
jgi:hypothetical protein